MAQRRPGGKGSASKATGGAHTADLAKPSPVESLPPTAQRILSAARRIVTKGGYGALSMQAVADEAGELKSTIAYHFGDKAGLISALLESVIHDGNVAAVRSLERIPTAPERLHELLAHQRKIAATSEYWRLLFALTPEIIKNKRLRARFGELMRFYYEIDLRCLGLREDEEPPKEFELFASLLLAVLEGFALQRELIPDDYDLDARFSLWEEIVTPYVERLQEQMAAQAEAAVADAAQIDARQVEASPADTVRTDMADSAEAAASS